MKKNQCRPFIYAICTLTITCCAFAEPQWRPASEVLTAARAVTTERFPDADSVLTYNLVHERYNADGTGEEWDDEYLTILTEKGRRNASSHSLYINTSYGTATVVRAEIYKPDGTSFPINIARQCRIMTEPGQMSANIYDPNNKILSLSIPNLEIGDTLHILTHRRTHKARVPNSWSDYTVFEYTTPILTLDYEISAPTALPLRHHLLRSPLSNTVSYTTSPLDNDRTLHRWQVRDVPRVFSEPSMPPLHTQVQRLMCSTLEDWPAVSRWYWELSWPRLNATIPEMTNMVAEITATATDRDERIRRIFTFVSQQIRYMGITDEEVAPGYEPHDVSMTFSNRYGVCRDKAALLVTLLRINGIEAFPVLIHAGAKLDPDIPLPYFNHAIVAATRYPAAPDSESPYILMDPTDENSRDLLPSYLCNRSYLVATPQGDPLRISPVIPAASNMLHITSSGTADPDGTLTLHTDITFEGINDTIYRNFLVRQKPEQRRKYFEGLLKARLAGAELTDFTITPRNLQETDLPLSVQFTSRILDWPIRGDGIDVIALPWLGTTMGYVNFLLGPTGLKERKYPLETSIACGVAESITINTADTLGQPRYTPTTLNLTRSGINFSLTTASDNKTLSGQLNYSIEQPEFTPAEYLDLRNSLQEMEVASRQRPAFEAIGGSATPDLRVLNANTHIELTDSHTWLRTETRTTQVLTYAGKKKASELTIDYNPAWQNATLLSATVSNSNGSRHNISPKEINLMDAGWVAGAPRYPAAKTLVANLPGVETGSVITTTIRIEQKYAPRFTLQTAFGGFEPIDHETITIVVPENLHLETATFNDSPISYTTTNINHRISHTWEVVSQPTTIPENNLPPWYLFKPALLTATDDIATGLTNTRQAFANAMHNQKQAATLAKELVRDTSNDEEAITAIRDYVLRRIRFAGPSFASLPANDSVTPADTTLHDGYGHSADRSILLATMLCAAGFDAEPILVNLNRQRPTDLYNNLRKFESPTAYSQVLVRINNRPGLLRRLFSSKRPLPLYLGDGDQYTILGTTGLDDHPCLDLNGKYSRIEVAPQFKDRDRTDWHIALDSHGTAAITVTNWYYGSSCGVFRKKYAEMPPEERRRHHLELVSGVSRSAEATSDLITAIHTYPGYSTFSIRAPRYAVGDADSLTLLLPGTTSYAIPLRDDRRTNPLHLTGQTDLHWSCTVELPPTHTATPVIPPPLNLTIPGNGGQYQAITRREQSANGTTILHFDRTLTTTPLLLAPEQYPTLIEINRRINNPAQRTVVISGHQ